MAWAYCTGCEYLGVKLAKRGELNYCYRHRKYYVGRFMQAPPPENEKGIRRFYCYKKKRKGASK
jgi:hypothetical protein